MSAETPEEYVAAQSPEGQAWLRGGQQRLQELQPILPALPVEPQRDPAALAR